MKGKLYRNRHGLVHLHFLPRKLYADFYPDCEGKVSYKVIENFIRRMKRPISSWQRKIKSIKNNLPHNFATVFGNINARIP